MKDDPEYYLERRRRMGDYHGQALLPVGRVGAAANNLAEVCLYATDWLRVHPPTLSP